MNESTKNADISLWSTIKYTVIIFFLIYTLWSLYTICLTSVQIASSDMNVDIFWLQVEHSRSVSDPKAITECLDHVIRAYPAGTIQNRGSLLNSITETSRKMAVQLIIEELKRKTGEDLGYDAKAWIDRYRGGVR